MSRSGITKRSHKKSRYGCLNCKNRRVKCDEGFPICKNCNRRGEDCSYKIIRPPEPSPQYIDTQYPDTPLSSSIPSICPVNGNQPTYPGQTLIIDPALTDYSTEDQIITQPKVKTEDIQLSSNNGQLMYPSYLSHTYMNNRAMLYFTSILHRRMFPNNTYINPWREIPHFALKYMQLHHLSLSISYLTMYHDAIHLKNPNANYLGLTDVNGYLMLSKLNHDAFESDKMLSQPIWQSARDELFSQLLICMFEAIHTILSPSSTICDSQFIWKCMFFDELVSQELPPMTEPTCAASVFGVYYSPSKPLEIYLDSRIYFPDYLIQICGNSTGDFDGAIQDHSDKRSDRVLTICSGASSTADPEDVMESFGELPHRKVTMSEEESLLFAVRSLKKEFNLAYNEKESDKDSFKVFLRWPMSLSPAFATLLSKQDNRALIIMAHYLMLVSSLPYDKLFYHKVCVNELVNISSIVADEYKGWLNVPMRALHLL